MVYFVSNLCVAVISVEEIWWWTCNIAMKLDGLIVAHVQYGDVV